MKKLLTFTALLFTLLATGQIDPNKPTPFYSGIKLPNIGAIQDTIHMDSIVEFEKMAVYGADLSSGYTDRSLVDKAYVDGAIPALQDLQSVLEEGNTSLKEIILNHATGLYNTTMYSGSVFFEDDANSMGISIVPSNGIVFHSDKFDIENDRESKLLGQETVDGSFANHLPAKNGTLAVLSDIPTNNNQLTNGEDYAVDTDVLHTTGNETKTGNLIIKGDGDEYGEISFQVQNTNGTPSLTVHGDGTITTDAEGLYNEAIGEGAFAIVDEDVKTANTAFGPYALWTVDSIAEGNTAIGYTAILKAGVNARHNTAVGVQALYNIGEDSRFNTAVGFDALGNTAPDNPLEADENTAIGAAALRVHDTGDFNTAVGAAALYSDVSGNDNTAIGVSAMRMNVDGANSVAVGRRALSQNTNGNNNTALGFYSLYASSGNNNTAIGFEAVNDTLAGSNNTYIGANITASALGVDNEVRISDGQGNLILDGDGISQHVDFFGTVSGSNAVDQDDFTTLSQVGPATQITQTDIAQIRSAVNYSMFNMNKLDSVVVTGTTSPTDLLNPTTGTATFMPDDMQVGASYKGIVRGVMDIGVGDDVDFTLGIGGQSVGIASSPSGADNSFLLEYAIDFLDGTDSARRFVITGQFRFQSMSGFAPIPDTILTIDATTPQTLNIKAKLYDSTDKIEVYKASLTRNTY